MDLDVDHVVVKMCDGPHGVWGIAALKVKLGALGGKRFSVDAEHNLLPTWGSLLGGRARCRGILGGRWGAVG